MEQRPSPSKTLKERQALRRKTQLMKWRKDEREKRAKLRKKERELRLEEKRLAKERKISEKEEKRGRKELEKERKEWLREKNQQEKRLERSKDNLQRHMRREMQDTVIVRNTVRIWRFETSLLDNKVTLKFTFNFGRGVRRNIKISGPHAKWVVVTAEGTKFMKLNYKIEGLNRRWLSVEKTQTDNAINICLLRTLRVPLSLPRATVADDVTMDLADDGTLTLSAPFDEPADLIGWETVFEPGAVQDPEVLYSSPVSAATKWLLAKFRFVE